MNPFFNTDAATLSPVALFLQADWVVKAVMIGLLLASVWTWAIIIGFVVRIRRTRRDMARFERDFWKAEDIDAFYKVHGESELPSARVFAAGVSEWRRSTAAHPIDKGGTRERLATAMG
ncbi:MAG TPA: Tol-Pal system subunit TolQ, partial [Sphingomonas sp.]